VSRRRGRRYAAGRRRRAARTRHGSSRRQETRAAAPHGASGCGRKARGGAGTAQRSGTRRPRPCRRAIRSAPGSRQRDCRRPRRVVAGRRPACQRGSLGVGGRAHRVGLGGGLCGRRLGKPRPGLRAARGIRRPAGGPARAAWPPRSRWRLRLVAVSSPCPGGAGAPVPGPTAAQCRAAPLGWPVQASGKVSAGSAEISEKSEIELKRGLGEDDTHSRAACRRCGRAVGRPELGVGSGRACVVCRGANRLDRRTIGRRPSAAFGLRGGVDGGLFSLGRLRCDGRLSARGEGAGMPTGRAGSGVVASSDRAGGAR